VTISGSPLGRAAAAVWYGPGPWAAAARALLMVPAAAYRAASLARNAAYDLGWLPSRPLVAPAIGIGNLAVGGSGKTPLARLIAEELQRRGCVVGILSRGYGGDEIMEYREALPGAVVVADADRRRGAVEAVRLGAGVLVLDDCLQRRDVRTDVMVAVVAAETAGRPRRSLPAGPWREGLSALERADVVAVTRKSASLESALRLADGLSRRTRRCEGLVVSLVPERFVPLSGGAPAGAEVIAGRSVTAVCGIGAPEAFTAQLEKLGAARVDLVAFGDHHAYTPGDIAAVRRRAGGLVVTTGKDAVKLRDLWPAGPPECWVAHLVSKVESGADVLARLVEDVAAACGGRRPEARREGGSQ